MAKSKKNSSFKSATAFAQTASPNQPEMKTNEIRDLIDFISQSGLNEVNIETKELKLHVKREPDQKVFKSTPVQMAAAPVAAVASAAVAPAAPQKPAVSGIKTVEIKSP